MKSIKDEIQEKIAAAFEAAGYEKELAVVVVSNRRIFASISATEQWLELRNISVRL